MTKPKFTIRTLLWMMIVVAAFFAGREAIRLPLTRELNALRDDNAALRENLLQNESRLAITSAKAMELEMALKEALAAD